MLTLSAIIATAGVLADSTATVIGAMIIAPLSTPIMSVWLAIGALWLFLSNLLALVLAGTVVFTVLGYAGGPQVGPEAGAEQASDVRTRRRAHRRAYVTLSVLFVLVGTPLVLHSLIAYYLAAWTTRVETAASVGIEAVPEGGAGPRRGPTGQRGAHPGADPPDELPPLDTLLEDLETEVPSGLPILVETTLGNRVDGIVGEEGDWPLVRTGRRPDAAGCAAGS